MEQPLLKQPLVPSRSLVTYDAACGAAASSSPDAPPATPAPVAHFPGRESNRGWPLCATSAADWPPCWPGDKPVWHSNAGARDCENPGRKTRCNSDTCIVWTGRSWSSKGTSNPGPEKQNHPRGRTAKREEGRRALSGRAGRKSSGRKRNFKPAVLIHFHFAADTFHWNFV